MIGWIILAIFAGLLLLIALLMAFSVTTKIEYSNEFIVKVRYLFITLYDSRKPPKPKKKKKRKSKSKKQKQTFVEKVAKNSGLAQVADDISKAASTASDTSSKDSTSKTAKFDFEMIKLIYDSAKPSVKRLIRKLRVENLHLNCVIGGEDAAKIALTYGLQSAAISGFLAWANELMTLKIKKVNVTADFDKEETDLQFKCLIRLRVFSAAICALQYVINASKQQSQPKPIKNNK